MKDQAKPKSSSAQFIEDTIKTFVRESPLNRLKEFDGGPIYDEPLVGFASGDDPLFQDYKRIIGDFHFTPREAFERHLREDLSISSSFNGALTVISFVLPVARTTRMSNRRETKGPSLRWNNTRWYGQPFAEALTRHVVSVLREQGSRAVAPDQMPLYQVLDLPNGRCSNWSQRHMAYAAGLGTFGLSDSFITPAGTALWCCSVVTDMVLPATPRGYANHLANCPFFSDGSCGACIQRCPAGAISAQGHDKIKCREEMYGVQKAWLEKPGYIGKYAGCGLCQTKVPCESRIPLAAQGDSSVV